jgi:hypothetical protein
VFCSASRFVRFNKTLATKACPVFCVIRFPRQSSHSSVEDVHAKGAQNRSAMIAVHTGWPAMLRLMRETKA